MVEQVGLLEKIESIIQDQNGIPFWNRKPIITRFIVIIICLIAIGYISYINLYNNSVYPQQGMTAPSNASTKPRGLQANAYVDLAGAVNKPGVYKVDQDTRLFMLIEQADGLHIDADREFIARNYNLSVPLTDQQKIYIPTVFDTQDGLLLENQKVVSTNLDQIQNTDSVIEKASLSSQNGLISLNGADMSELMDLPGVGEVTAQRIISSRPYSMVEDIVEKGIIKQSLYDKIKNMLVP